MTMRLLISLFLGFIFFLGFQTACTTDRLPEPEPPELCDTLQVSYNLQVREIINTNCSFAGCHSGGTQAPGNYTTFAGLEPFLTEREFERFVIDLRNDPDLGMPPNWETNPGPQDLTPEEFDIVSCWVEAGYPEN